MAKRRKKSSTTPPTPIDPDVLLETIRNDYYHAAYSWRLFLQSNGPFDNPNKSLIEAVNRERISLSFNFIQGMAIADCILSLCRLTDKGANDRVNLAALELLIARDRELLIRSARERFANDRAEIRQSMQDGAAKATEEKIDSILKSAAKLRASKELSDVRSHRDAVLAHSLANKPPPPKTSDVEEVLSMIRPMIIDAYFVLNGTAYVMEMAEDDLNRHFSTFWSVVELGLNERMRQREAEIDKLYSKFGIARPLDEQGNS